MAQLTSSTSSVTATNGIIWENQPINAKKVIQAYKIDNFILNTGDATLYPAIVFVVDYGFQNNNSNPPTKDNKLYWAYASGDTATRNLDYVTVNDEIGKIGGGGGGTEVEVTFESLQLDAAGSLPVSQRIITGSYLQTRDNLPILIDRAGTGTQSYNNGHVDMSVTAGQYALAQAKSFSPYLPGKPTNIKLTFFDFDNEANVTKRVGFGSRSTVAPYTADFDGFYFEADGTTYNIVTRNSATTASISVAQASWDDALDGTGPSGLTADFEQFTVLEFDFLFLGGTALRCFINVGGQRVLFHTIKWSNANTDTIFRNPAQPIFYEIRSTTGTGSLAMVCASTEVQGSLELIGIPRSVNNAITHINANDTANTYLLDAVRLKSTQRDIYAKLTALTLLATTADNFLYSIILNPTIAGAALTWNGLTNSGIEHAVGDAAGSNTITGGTVLESGYGAQRATFFQEINGLIRLGTQIDGTQDVLTLCARPLSSNMDILGSLDIIEI